MVPGALRLVIASPIGRVQALVVHLRPPVSDGGSFISGHFQAPKIHKMEIERFCQTLDRRLPTVVVGDFNEENDGSAIVYLVGPQPPHDERAAAVRARSSDLALAHQLRHVRAPARSRRLRRRAWNR